MRLCLIAVDRIREPYVAAALDDFRTRLRRYERYDEIEVAAARGTDPQRAMLEEAERILGRIDPSDTVWLLDREGTMFSSESLAQRLRALADGGAQRLVLVIGGAYGAHERVAQRANLRWSLSPLTFLHEWSRALVLEQLYRAAKIARNEPYHH